MITIYGATMSPFVRKVLAVASEKGIAVESRQIGLGSNDPDFLAASPFRKIPALRDGDFTVSDSSAIVQYFEAICPDPSLIPVEAKARARTIWWDEFADTILTAAGGKMFFNRIVAPRFLGQPGDQAAADKAEAEELPPVLEYLERMLPDSGHLVEDRLTLADIAVASPFANIAHAGFVLDAARWPRTAKFAANILARPSFAAMVARETKALAG
nr:glutathione S-transferase family protein [Polymorphobacter sp.]